MFVKWECGCLGIQIFHESRPVVSIVFKVCDDDNDPFGMCIRDMSNKASSAVTYSEMTELEQKTLIENINLLIIKGTQLNEIRRMLKW
jgi:hypothetical protein